MGRVFASREVMLRRLEVRAGGVAANAVTRRWHEVRLATIVPDDDPGRAATTTLRGHALVAGVLHPLRPHGGVARRGPAPAALTQLLSGDAWRSRQSEVEARIDGEHDVRR